MTQASRSDFAYAGYRVHIAPHLGRAALATGGELPVASPALELQRALDEMFSPSPPVAQPDYTRVAAVSFAMAAVFVGCGAFWWTAIQWAASFAG